MKCKHETHTHYRRLGTCCRIGRDNIGGPGVNGIETNLFSITGKTFTSVLATPLTIDRTSYARLAGGSEIDIFSHSAGNATIVVSATGIPPPR